ncbi:hypothetical protein RRG46_01600 [Mycoplasmopsis cynos]|uniref:Uncharacterized protein n=2 Tax=Mycoplasmopsis cynos TaxID=171284 RepID=A0ABD8AJW6_9BACT|nr:hypothetical protein [Mycoplasmopsis cynos]WQQ20225.1 hypothetical protein RRG46_01600 [Mycoplasmopsis cynos]
MTKKLKNFIKFGGILCALSAATSIPLLSILISKSKSGIKETARRNLDLKLLQSSLAKIDNFYSKKKQELTGFLIDNSKKISNNNLKISSAKKRAKELEVERELNVKNDNFITNIKSSIFVLKDIIYKKIYNDELFVKFKNSDLLLKDEYKTLKIKTNLWIEQINPAIQTIHDETVKYKAFLEQNKLQNNEANLIAVEKLNNISKDWNKNNNFLNISDINVKQSFINIFNQFAKIISEYNQITLLNEYNFELILQNINLNDININNISKLNQLLKDQESSANNLVTNIIKNNEFLKSHIDNFRKYKDQTRENKAISKKYYDLNDQFINFYLEQYKSFEQTLTTLANNKNLGTQSLQKINDIKEKHKKEQQNVMKKLILETSENKVTYIFEKILVFNNQTTLDILDIYQLIVNNYQSFYNQKITKLNKDLEILNQISKLNHSVYQNEQEIENIKQKNKSLLSENEIIQEQKIALLDTDESKLKGLDKKIASNNELINTNNFVITKKTNEIQKIINKVREYESTLKKSNTKNNEIINEQNKNFALSSFLKSLIDFKNIKIDLLENDFKLLSLRDQLNQGQIKDLKSIIKNSQNDNNALKAKSQELKKIITSKENEIKNLNQELQKILSLKDIRIQNLNNQLEKITTEKDAQIKELNYGIEKLKIDKDNLIQSINQELQKVTLEKNVQIQELNQQIQKLNEKLRKNVLDNKNKIQELNQELQKVTLEKDNEIKRLNQELESVASEKEIQIQNLNEELQKVSSEKEIQIQNLNKEVEGLQHNLKEKDNKINEQKNIINEKQQKIRKLEEEILELNTNVANLNVIINEKDQEINKLNSTINNLNNQLNNQNNQINSLKNQNQNNNNQIAKLQDDLRKKINDYNEIYAKELSNDEKINSINRANEILENEIENYKNNISSINNNRYNLKNALRELKDKLIKTQNEVEKGINSKVYTYEVSSSSYHHYGNSAPILNTSSSYSNALESLSKTKTNIINMISFIETTLEQN